MAVGLLPGVRVLDFAQGISGPYFANILALNTNKYVITFGTYSL